MMGIPTDVPKPRSVLEALDDNIAGRKAYISQLQEQLDAAVRLRSVIMSAPELELEVLRSILRGSL